jgi:DNA primase
VAPLGTALTREQLRLLKALADDVVLLFDGDEAGLKAAERSVPLFLAEQISGRVALLPQNHDPDTFIAEFGVERLRDLIKTAAPLPEYLLQQLIERHGETLDGKFRIIENLRPLLSSAASAVQRDTMARHFASLLDVDAQRLLAEIAPSAPKPETRQQPRRAPTGDGAAGLDGALKSVLGFMIRNPHHFERLLEHEIDRVLEGTVGETICIQLKTLLDRGTERLEPEELFSELPPGEERAIVASMLVEVAESGDGGEDSTDMLAEVLGWLDRQRLKRRSEDLMRDIKRAEANGESEIIPGLLVEKMKVDRDLKRS